MRQLSSLWAGALAIALTLGTTGAVRAADPENGRTLAQTHCSRCHIVPGYDSMSIGITPSFEGMAKKDNRHEAFAAFYALRPHPAFVRIEGVAPLNDLPPTIAPIHLTLDEVADIAAFADEIAEQP